MTSQRLVRITAYEATLYCGVSHLLREGRIRHLASIERYSSETDQSWIVHSFVDTCTGDKLMWAQDLGSGEVERCDWHGNRYAAIPAVLENL